jgi:hypothetical protein
MLRLTDPAPVNPPEVEEAMPLPADPKVVYLGGLFFLGLAAALYVAAEIVWPLVIAFMLSLLLKPVQRVLTRLHVPRLGHSQLRERLFHDIVVFVFSSRCG